jgi:chorismate mutase / prephenate dehydratase
MGEKSTILFWREQIDAIDSQIIDLLNQRAALAVQIGTAKKEQNLPVRDPAREAQVLQRVAAKNPGPVLTEDLQKVYSAIMNACRNLEKKQ